MTALETCCARIDRNWRQRSPYNAARTITLTITRTMTQGSRHGPFVSLHMINLELHGPSASADPFKAMGADLVDLKHATVVPCLIGCSSCHNQ